MPRTQIDALIRLWVVISMLFTHLSPVLVLASPAVQQEEPTATPTETVDPTATETATVATVEVTETASKS